MQLSTGKFYKESEFVMLETWDLFVVYDVLEIVSQHRNGLRFCGRKYLPHTNTTKAKEQFCFIYFFLPCDWRREISSNLFVSHEKVKMCKMLHIFLYQNIKMFHSICEINDMDFRYEVWKYQVVKICMRIGIL